MDEASNREGQSEKKRNAIPGTVVSDQDAGGDCKTEQSRNDLRAGPCEWVQDNIEVSQKMTEDYSSGAGYDRWPPSAIGRTQFLKSFQDCHVWLDAPQSYCEASLCWNEH